MLCSVYCCIYEDKQKYVQIPIISCMLLKLYSSFKESSHCHNKYLIMSRINKYLTIIRRRRSEYW